MSTACRFYLYKPGRNLVERPMMPCSGEEGKHTATSNLLKEIFSDAGNQKSLGISPAGKWVLSDQCPSQPKYHLGVRPYGLVSQPDFCSSTSPRQLRQTALRIENNKLLYPASLPLCGFRKKFLSLPAEIRLMIYDLILPPSTRVHESGISLPTQIVVNSRGQLDVRSLKKRSPAIYRCLPFLNERSLGREFGDLFWRHYEVVVDCKGLISFLKGSASQRVQSLKIVIGIWDHNNVERWEEDERLLTDQMKTLLIRRPTLESVKIVICNWKSGDGPYRKIDHKITLKGQTVTLSEEICSERNRKWRALAEPLLELRKRGLLKSLVLRLYKIQLPHRLEKTSILGIADDGEYDSSAEEWESTKAEIEGPSWRVNIDRNNWIVSHHNPTLLQDKVREWGLARQEAPGYRKSFSYDSKNILFWLDEAVAKHEFPH